MKRLTKISITPKLLIYFFIVFGFANTNELFADNLKLIKEKSIETKPGESLFIDASGADIKIESWNKNEVHVKIFGNKKAEEKMEFKIFEVDNGVRIESKKKSSWFFNWGSGYSVRIEVMIPQDYNNYLETSGGDISLKNTSGKSKLETSGGDVTLMNTKGELKVETSGGDIRLINHSGDSNLSTSGGDIVTTKLIGNVNASTSGGDISLEVQNGKIDAETSGGDIEIKYEGENQGIVASTSGGDIKLFLPAHLKANVNLESFGGDIDCNFSNFKSTKVSRGRMKAEFNGGGKKIECSTSGGDVIVNEK